MPCSMNSHGGTGRAMNLDDFLSEVREHELGQIRVPRDLWNAAASGLALVTVATIVYSTVSLWAHSQGAPPFFPFGPAYWFLTATGRPTWAIIGSSTILMPSLVLFAITKYFTFASHNETMAMMTLAAAGWLAAAPLLAAAAAVALAILAFLAIVIIAIAVLAGIAMAVLGQN